MMEVRGLQVFQSQLVCGARYSDRDQDIWVEGLDILSMTIRDVQVDGKEILSMNIQDVWVEGPNILFMTI